MNGISHEQYYRFEADVTIKLKRDEAIVLFAYLSRELYSVPDEKTCGEALFTRLKCTVF